MAKARKPKASAKPARPARPSRAAKPKHAAKPLRRRPSAARQPAAKKPAGKKPGARRPAAFQPPPPVVDSAPHVPGARKADAEAYRDLQAKLLSLRERITGQIDFLASDNLSRKPQDNEINFRSEEQGTDNFDRDFALNRVSLEQNIVFEIDEALHRLRLGTYGACEGCGGPIEKARLQALPYSRMCVRCQSRAESGRHGFRSAQGASLFPNADKSAPDAADDDE